ncbi:hypothetical protein ACFLXQ_01440 [Chloroflexota bacterium]
MTLAIKNLSDGQLPSTEGDLYLVPADTSAVVRMITLTNKGTGTNSVTLYIKPSGGTSRSIGVEDLPMGTKEHYFDDGPYSLETGDAIRGVATNASEVDYYLGGTEDS